MSLSKCLTLCGALGIISQCDELPTVLEVLSANPAYATAASWVRYTETDKLLGSPDINVTGLFVPDAAAVNGVALFGERSELRLIASRLPCMPW